MVRENEIREGELAVTPPEPTDAGLVFIGCIQTPWTSRLMAPRQGRDDGPICRITVLEPWVGALDGIERFDRIIFRAATSFCNAQRMTAMREVRSRCARL